MVKRVLLTLLVLFVVLAGGLFFWARAVFTGETVRTALAGQLSEALGQPVAIGSISAAIYPRVTVNLGDVAIGNPARLNIERLQVGASLRALFSRRIEHADLRLSGGRIELPLPPFAFGSGGAGDSGADPGPVELVSVDEIVLSDVQIVSGGRTLRADVALVPQAKGVLIREATLHADSASVKITGQIDDLAGPSGELAVSAGALNLDELLVFVSEFTSHAGMTASAAPGAPPPSPMNLSMSLSADSAKLGTLTLDRLSGNARISREAMTLEPIGFGLFGGKYAGTLRFALGTAHGFQMAATLADIDMAEVMTFAGSAGAITGRLSGRLDLAGAGADAAGVLKSAKGTSRVDITNGTVRNLGLVRTIVLAGSGRSDAAPASGDLSRDEKFSRLGATLAILNGDANTSDLRFESEDLLLSAAGYFRLDGTAIDLKGQVQLSEALAARAGRDLVRYTQEQGRPTLPVTIRGSAGNPQVSVDMAGLLRRAITNRAKEEVQEGIKRRLGGLFQK
jgi:uncharacterized protein involved in outer membrane biogenesis